MQRHENIPKASRSRPAVETVRDQLERILASPAFQATEKRRAFLRYVVEETLAGRADQIKGYTVAVAVFDRPESFDPESDPVVRLEARRLRHDLDRYYVLEGSRDPVRISIPKGGYVPTFEYGDIRAANQEPQEIPQVGDGAASREAPDPEEERTIPASRWPTRPWLIGLAFGLVVALVLIGWRATRNEPFTDQTAYGPAVGIAPFKAFGHSDDSRFLATGIQDNLITDLSRFSGFRIYPFPATAASDPDVMAHVKGVAYVIDGSVLVDTEKIRVTARLRDVANGELLWSQAFDRALVPDNLIDLQSDLAAEIATALGQPYGAVAGDLVRAKAKTPAVRNMQSYICVLRAFGYRRSFSQAEIGPVLGCLEQAVRRDPDYSDAWAMLAWLQLDEGRYLAIDDPDHQYAIARKNAERALKLDPSSTLALGALSAIEHYMGNYDHSIRLARRALALNPNDPETMAQLGWRLTVRGKWTEGGPLLEEAVARTANPPAWYQNTLALYYFLEGDYGKMLKSAELGAEQTGQPFSRILIAIANGEMGNRAATETALRRAQEAGSFDTPPEEFFRRHGASDEISAALAAGLARARQVAAGTGATSTNDTVGE